MKKFFLTACVSTPSPMNRDASTVKGIYTALFILILTSTLSAQIELKDNNNAVPFNKWEIGVDLKPLFRNDEPYNVMAKWHFTEKKAIRLRIGSASSMSSFDSVSLFNQDLIRTNDLRLQYKENYSVHDKKIDGQFSIGYQYSFRNKHICFYTATEISYEQNHDDYRTLNGVLGYLNYNLYDSLKSNIYYNKNDLIYLKYKVKTFEVSQIIGIGYKFNQHLSLSSELSFGYYKTNYSLSKENNLPPNSSAVIETVSEFTSSGIRKGFFIKPLLGLYLNYHF